MLSLAHFRRHRIEAQPPPSQDATGGPPEENERERRTQRRLGFVERRLDRLAQRVKRLEDVVEADAIAPLDGPNPLEGGER